MNTKPWVEAARAIGANAVLDESEEIIKRACEQHANALLKELAACKEALEAARPIVKARLCSARDWSEAEGVLEKIEAALK
jgi:hypothetical protein